ncbi:hypothetical protein EJ08DRAFT_212546 [Tothia fuscella]|uniref:Uncharacterized protein n=1 Tax=Tothia fuscella TaxID=1048955 RepID=A0A9P4NTA5_9PEZI|nr:hypothetical protein EJ08DRAFT_212546 [Tothia fuscella]
MLLKEVEFGTLTGATNRNATIWIRLTSSSARAPTINFLNRDNIQSEASRIDQQLKNKTLDDHHLQLDPAIRAIELSRKASFIQVAVSVCPRQSTPVTRLISRGAP